MVEALNSSPLGSPFGNLLGSFGKNSQHALQETTEVHPPRTKRIRIFPTKQRKSRGGHRTLIRHWKTRCKSGATSFPATGNLGDTFTKNLSPCNCGFHPAPIEHHLNCHTHR